MNIEKDGHAQRNEEGISLNQREDRTWILLTAHPVLKVPHTTTTVLKITAAVTEEEPPSTPPGTIQW